MTAGMVEMMMMAMITSPKFFRITGMLPKKIPAHDQQHHPADPPDHVIADELPVAHPADAGDKRRERPDDRDEPRDDDGLGAVFLVKTVCPVQVFFFEEPVFLAREDLGTDEMADPVVSRVPEDGGRAEDNEQPDQVQRFDGGERPGGEQEGIARQKGCHDKPRLQEDDEEQDRVSPQPVGLDQTAQVLVEVKDEVDNALNQVHALLPKRTPLYYTAAILSSIPRTQTGSYKGTPRFPQRPFGGRKSRDAGLSPAGHLTLVSDTMVQDKRCRP